MAPPHFPKATSSWLLLFLLFALAPAAYAKLPAKSVHGVNAAGYQAWINEMKKEDLRPITVSVYGDAKDPKYAASAIKDGKNYPWESRHNLTIAQHQKTFDELTKKGYRPVCYSVYSHDKDFNVASLWVKDGLKGGMIAKTGMTVAAFQKEFDANAKLGMRPILIQGYPAGKEPNFAAIFINDGNKNWYARHNIDGAEYQKMFDEWPKKGYRPQSVSAYPVGNETRFAVTFVNDGLSADAQARHGLTGAQYQTEFTRLGKLGYRPLQVCGYGANKDLHYAVIFVGDRDSGGAAVGQWSPVMQWPVVAIHAAMLPTGKVLIFPRLEDDGDKPRPPADSLPHLWDPANPNAKPISTPRPPYNLFCSGHSFLADGRLVFAGGHKTRNLLGEKRTCVYEPFQNIWVESRPMYERRWYPACVTLPNGDVVCVGGTYEEGKFTSFPELWSGNAAAFGKWSEWNKLDGANEAAAPLVPFYPFLHVAPNGLVFQAGPNVKTFYLDVKGKGRWLPVGDRTFRKDRDSGSSVMYEPGRILMAGGGFPPTASAETIDLNSGTPTWRAAESMRHARRQMNATILADGTVFVSGGTATAKPFKDPNNPKKEAANLNDFHGAVFNTEIWDPKTGHWVGMAPQAEVRLYHSTALLLPDGRVLSCGSGEPSGDPPGSDRDHRTAQIYSPPYLFRGPRPVITNAPQTVGYGKTMTLATPDATQISQVNFIRLGSTTHTRNFDQRLNHLSHRVQGTSLIVTAPPNANLAPPGYYMLFLLNDKGVPSSAKLVRLN